eukprot:33830_2
MRRKRKRWRTRKLHSKSPRKILRANRRPEGSRALTPEHTFCPYPTQTNTKKKHLYIHSLILHS